MKPNEIEHALDQVRHKHRAAGLTAWPFEIGMAHLKLILRNQFVSLEDWRGVCEGLPLLVAGSGEAPTFEGLVDRIWTLDGRDPNSATLEISEDRLRGVDRKTDDDPLEVAIYVALRTAPKIVRNGFAGKNAMDGDAATRQLAKRTADAVRTHYRTDKPSAPSTH